MTKLLWKSGIGYYSVQPQSQKPNYYSIYKKYEKTQLGQKLNQFRINLVNKYIKSDSLLDFGCGSCYFIRERNKIYNNSTFGYDVDKNVVKYLKKNKLYKLPKNIKNISFWDSLEHIDNFKTLLSEVKNHIFVTIPIFTSKKHVLNSKHFRRNEHYWYFTSKGLKNILGDIGFKCLYECDTESKLGRKDISTFVFVRN